MTKSASKLKKIESLYKEYRKNDAVILQEEPCCKVNTKNIDIYCEFHSLLNDLGKILQEQNQGNLKRDNRDIESGHKAAPRGNEEDRQ
jgi:hypothetical protein